MNESTSRDHSSRIHELGNDLVNVSKPFDLDLEAEETDHLTSSSDRLTSSCIDDQPAASWRPDRRVFCAGNDCGLPDRSGIDDCHFEVYPNWASGLPARLRQNRVGFESS